MNQHGKKPHQNPRSSSTTQKAVENALSELRSMTEVSSSATTTRPNWNDYFLDIARVVATRADCTRRQVGAVIVKNNRIISTGYNGAPAGDPGCATQGACPRGKLSVDEQPRDVGYSNCISVHAEANAILYAYQELSGATLYCTDAPCVECAKLIRGAGIGEVIHP